MANQCNQIKLKIKDLTCSRTQNTNHTCFMCKTKLICGKCTHRELRSRTHVEIDIQRNQSRTYKTYDEDTTFDNK